MDNTEFNSHSDTASEQNFNTTKNENQNSIFNIRVKAGSKRTYFFDVKTNKKGDYFIVVTERRRRFDDEGSFDKNKLFLYKEDFNKFVKALTDTVDHVKTTLMPDFDFGVFDREYNKFSANEEGHDNSNTGGGFSDFKKDFEENDKL